MTTTITEAPASTKMNPEVKASWVAALRSGEYQQGAGNLHVTASGTDMFCCLGVLCELAVKAGVPVRTSSEHYGEEYAAHSYDGTSALAPISVFEWAGLPLLTREVWTEAGYEEAPSSDQDIKVLDKDGAQRTVSLVNDQGASFNEIADIIEEQL